ncbi:styrene monooxygenase/indole monooxygenase family protein [Nonomuraea sp. NPDC047529]|uniref:styrene monooxygenase/indole monooxygenase family protein n=1 Tax=Nonomuraea sp. NPDC047529 TaxID=3155623 RepID=UPI003400B085
MTGVGIVGAGISGLTLALRLQQLGVPTTLYSEGDAEDLGRGRLPNTVGRMARAQARERELGSLHFLDPGCLLTAGRLSIKGDPPLEFTARVAEPFHAVDFRVLLPALMDDYTSRGGHLVVDPLQPDAGQVDRWSRGHELMVVATGRRSVRELFPRDPARSPYLAPQRVLAAGLFRGFDPGPAFGFNISPGCGEILSMAMMTRAGVRGGVLVEAIPGGPLEVLARVPVHEFAEALLAPASRADRGRGRRGGRAVRRGVRAGGDPAHVGGGRAGHRVDERLPAPSGGARPRAAQGRLDQAGRGRAGAVAVRRPGPRVGAAVERRGGRARR